MTNKNIFPAILAGAAAGTILGILFAPQKGSDTRNELLADCNNWFDKTGRKKQETEWDNEPVEEKAIPIRVCKNSWQKKQFWDIGRRNH